jgi:hypothetical protein
MSLGFVSNSGVAKVSYESNLLAVGKLAIAKGSRQPIEEDESFRKDRYLMYAHGPILEQGKQFKYGLEYVFEVTTLKDFATGEITILGYKVSVLELTYCDFLYQNDDDYRFRRRSFYFASDLSLTKADSFIRAYHEIDNDGLCVDSKPGIASEQEFKVGVDDLLQLELALSAFN